MQLTKYWEAKQARDESSEATTLQRLKRGQKEGPLLRKLELPSNSTRQEPPGRGRATVKARLYTFSSWNVSLHCKVEWMAGSNPACGIPKSSEEGRPARLEFHVHSKDRGEAWSWLRKPIKATFSWRGSSPKRKSRTITRIRKRVRERCEKKKKNTQSEAT